MAYCDKLVISQIGKIIYICYKLTSLVRLKIREKIWKFNRIDPRTSDFFDFFPRPFQVRAIRHLWTRREDLKSEQTSRKSVKDL